MTSRSPRGFSRLLRQSLCAAAVAALAAAAPARADRLGDVAKQVAGYAAEVQTLGTALPRPGKPAAEEGQERRLVDAQVAFSLGKSDAAALMLYDLAQKADGEVDTALYYLGESLLQKGDRVAARGYFSQLVGSYASSKYYQQGLERLIELSIALGDSAGVDEWQAALVRIPAAQRRPSVPYVLGKHAFSQGKHDDALALLRDVPKGSAYELQALYFAGATHIAKKDLGKATEVFDDLVTRRPRSSVDRRVIELGQLALGRVYYERDQPSKSIDAYLLVDRKSDLFPDALYEVAWVYVKSKQYDKALGALELLALSDPSSSKTATVQLLEGNLRIRKAQMLKQKELAGIDPGGQPGVEYDKARALFERAHEQYTPSYDELERMLAAKEDASQFLAQITGRSSRTFNVSSAMPEVAAAWVREEPEVQRVVSVESDLAQIESNILEAELTIQRLEGLLDAPRRGNVYPPLVERRNRLVEIQEAVIAVRSDLADQQRALLRSTASVDAAGARRAEVGRQIRQQPGAELAYADRLAKAQEEFSRFEEGLSEIEMVLDSSEAMAVALRKYGKDMTLPPEVQGAIERTLTEVAPEVESLRHAMIEVRREVVLGRDLAGTGDESAVAAARLRYAMRLAQDDEQRALAAAAQGSKDAKQSQRLADAGAAAAKVAAEAERVDSAIDALVDEGLKDVRQRLAEERKSLAEYKAEFAAVEAESRGVGGSVLSSTFASVRDRLYDVVIHSDVGVIDVSWSQKEEADTDLKRYNLARQRELKQLRDEFRDIIEEAAAKPAAPAAPAPSAEPAPGATPTGTAPSASTGAPAAPAAPAARATTPAPAPAPAAGKGAKS